MAKDFTKTQWVPILLPKEALKSLLKESKEAVGKSKSHLAKLKSLQKAVKKAKLFEGMTEEEILEKLHKTRQQIWKEKYAKYYSNSR